VSQLDQHLTTEQLSTWLDQQLVPEEQAYCRAHLEDCEQCQDVLDDLQQTVNLLQSLPQMEVPRSFALPADFKITFDGTEKKRVEQSTAISSRRLPTPLRRTLRTVSALVAVIGLFFALSGFVAMLSQVHPGATSTSSVSAPYTAQSPVSPQSRQGSQAAGGFADDSHNGKYGAATSDEVGGKQNSSAGTNSTATWPIPPFLDFNLPGVRLSFGALLVILGGISFTLLGLRLERRTRSVKRNL
jgi:hypothetical protein